MLEVLNPLRELTFLSILFRTLLAVVCGGVIGIEREYKCRDAGFRTHILICLGAAMTTMTSQYLLTYQHYFTDVARLGAQVICGIGFIGAGSIIVTKHKRVKGLTTAAGLWTVAIVGLSCGAAYFEAALLATILIYVSESLFSRIEYGKLIKKNIDVSLYIEYEEAEHIDQIIEFLKKKQVKIQDLEVNRIAAKERETLGAILMLRINRNSHMDEIMNGLSVLTGVTIVEVL